MLEIRRKVVVARHDDVLETRGVDAPPEGRASSVVPVKRTQVWALATKHDTLIPKFGGFIDELLDRKPGLPPGPRITHRKEDRRNQGRSLSRSEPGQPDAITTHCDHYDLID